MWVQWLWAVPFRGRQVVCLNIDETPVCRQMQPGKGYVVMAMKRHDVNCYARVPVRDRRGQSTLLACITNVAGLQKHMPQFLLTKDKNLTNAEKSELARLPLPMRWVKGTAGWVSADVLKRLITLYRKAVREQMPNAEVVIFLDCATIHTADEVLTHCSRLGVHICLIPGGLTYLCQPLDSHVFATFKRILSELQDEERDKDPLGVLSGTKWIDTVKNATTKVFVDREWSLAFRENGMEQSFEHVRSKILSVCEAFLPLPLRKPLADELDVLLGRKRHALEELVFRASTRLANRPVLIMQRPVGRLPPARPAQAFSGVDHSGSGASSSSSGGPLVPPPLPPPAEPPPAEVTFLRFTRSGSNY